MIGDRSGETYRLGDAVMVKLVEAAPVAGALRFELLSEGRYDRAAKRQSRPPEQHRNSERKRNPERQRHSERQRHPGKRRRKNR
jgi:ribonuclease R